MWDYHKTFGTMVVKKEKRMKMEYILAQGSRHIYQKILHCSSKEKDLKSYRNIFL